VGGAVRKRDGMTPVPYPRPMSAAVSAVMRGNRSRDTGPEVRLRSLMHSRGYRFRVNYAIQATGVRVRADLAFPRRRVAVFVDGCFWHSCREHGNSPRVNTRYWQPKLERVVERDRRTADALRVAGWTVVRVWEHTSAEKAADMIGAALSKEKVC
jgi:DNA mismatch endonuclease, patch repair protein